MSQLLQLFIWIPFIGFLISTLLPRKRERWISFTALVITGSCMLGNMGFVFYWLQQAHPTLDIKHIVLFQTENIEIFIDFYFDKTTAVFSVMGAILTFIVSLFSRYYLHRDEGFKRFFSILLLFFMSYNFVVFAGNFETLFIGWEILGMCSFLLIAFYRDRYLPVRNSLKVISVYRFGDICLILAMWMSHHLWHQNITFNQLNDTNLVLQHLAEHNWYAVFIAGMIVLAATAKSAQLPFSSWLPRAMEGPTTSSAIFYGALSVHLGVFLLLRTYPYWESLFAIKVVIVTIGLSTSLVASAIAKVQATVKTQIAYASIAQIGLIFCEIALGLHTLALLHFVGNACFKTYQLLVSPSVMSYRIHDMLFSFVPSATNSSKTSLSRIRNSIYLLSIKEWNLDFNMQRFMWNPFKIAGKSLVKLNSKVFSVLILLFFLIGLYCAAFQNSLPENIFSYLPHFYSFLGLIIIIRAFVESGNAIRAWVFAVSGQLFITIAISMLNENFGQNHIFIYLSGSIISALVGFLCLQRIQRQEGDIRLNKFHGHVYEHPKVAFVFLLACLGFIGLPFTPTFIGIDILFSHIHKHEEIIIIFTSLSFLVMEIAALRIYARIFLGQHQKAYHPIAFRSS